MPYAGTDLMIYNALKNAYAERHPGREPSTLTFLACGAVSSTIGQAVAYPLQVVRTRLQALHAEQLEQPLEQAEAQTWMYCRLHCSVGRTGGRTSHV